MFSKNLFLGLSVLTLIIFNRASYALETVTMLDRGEPYPAMIADTGVFWIGRSRKEFNTNYHLEAYNPDGHFVDSANLTHSLSSIKKVGNGTIIITGINPTTQLTEYTFAKLEKEKIRFKTTQINVEGFINFWIGSLGGQHYFADMGGNPNDTNNNPNEPAQTIFSSPGSSPHYLNARVRMPLAGEIIQGKLLLVSSEGYSLPSGSLVEVDPLTSATRVILASKTAKFRGIELIPGTDDILTTAAGENKLLVVNRITGEIRKELPTIGYTRSFNLMGHCVLAGNDESNTVEVFDLKSKSTKAIFTEKIDLPFDEFSGLTQISTDEKTGTVFARANFPCNPFIEVCDKDYNRVVTFGPVVANKVLKLCR